MNLVANGAFNFSSKTFIALFRVWEHKSFLGGNTSIGDSLPFHMSAWLVHSLSCILVNQYFNISSFFFSRHTSSMK